MNLLLKLHLLAMMVCYQIQSLHWTNRRKWLSSLYWTLLLKVCGREAQIWLLKRGNSKWTNSNNSRSWSNNPQKNGPIREHHAKTCNTLIQSLKKARVSDVNCDLRFYLMKMVEDRTKCLVLCLVIAMIIKNILPTTTVETILKALDPFAYLDERNVRLVKGKSPGSKCFCFVDMDSHEVSYTELGLL